MSTRPTVSGKCTRPALMRGRGASSRVPAGLQPSSTRLTPMARTSSQLSSSSSSASESSDETESEPDQAQPGTPTLPAIGQVNPVNGPATQAPVRTRGRAKSYGGVSFTPARGSNRDTWWVNYRGVRRHYYSRVAAHDAIALFRTNTICAACEQPLLGDNGLPVNPPPVPANPVQANPVPANPVPAAAATQPISCIALAAGVIQVTINGATLTVNGTFTYP